MGVDVDRVRIAGEGQGLPEAETKSVAFAEFVAETERGLRQALTASLGSDVGTEAAAEALAYGWEHWERIHDMTNPSGYLYRVGLNWGRKARKRRTVAFPPVVHDDGVWVEPGLPEALSRLSAKQRLVVYLVHGHDWSLAEVAELLGISKGTVQTHMERGMTKLRNQLKVET